MKHDCKHRVLEDNGLKVHNLELNTRLKDYTMFFITMNESLFEYFTRNLTTKRRNRGKNM